MEGKYEILDKIKKIENKHNKLKASIISKLDYIEKTKIELENEEKEIIDLEKEYVSLIEKFVEIKD